MFLQEDNVNEIVLIGCSSWSKWRMSIVAFLVITYSTALIGNGLNILVVVSDPQLHNPVYFFLCNLSVVDLCIITTVVSQAIRYSSTFMLVPGENVTEIVLIGCSSWFKWRMSIVFFLVITYSISLIGNGLNILVVVFDPRLHSPMYFFLCNLSMVDLCIVTAVVPQTIVNCLVEKQVIPLPLCYIQLTLGHIFGVTECFLLIVMAYDRYVAISSPLHYMLIMNSTVCIVLVTLVWMTAHVLVIVPVVVIPVKLCGNNVVDHFVCEVKAVFKVLCGDVTIMQIVIYGAAIVAVVVPLCLILCSYLCIVVSIMRMNSEGSRMKAFSTCGSHLAVVTLFFGTIILSYILPRTKEAHLTDKIITGCYGVLTPMLNPLIYTLRNKEILGALKRLFSKKK